MTSLEETKKYYTSRGYSREDIDLIIEYMEEFYDRCGEIAADCEEEGYPSHGSNYDLRVENEWKECEEAIRRIERQYGDADEPGDDWSEMEEWEDVEDD